MKRVFHFRASSSPLGPLEERLLEALWARGNATVRDLLHDTCHDLAYTTVMTTLDRLFKKNLLSREAEGRAFRYAPRCTREQLQREVAGEAFRQLLDANPGSSLRALSVAVSLCWRTLRLRSEKYPVRRTADLLFGLRMFPLITAVVITAAFTVPSFLLLEPRAIHEPLSDIPLLLGTCGAVLSLVGLWNAGLAMRGASRTISTWTREAQSVESCAPVPVLRISRAVPAMTAAGIIRPRVLVSSVAEFLLTTNELQTALNQPKWRPMMLPSRMPERRSIWPQLF